MKLFRIPVLLLTLFLTACATQRQPEILTTEFQQLSPIVVDAKLPSRPKAKLVTDIDGSQYAGFTLVGMDDLNTYSKQAEANTEALREVVSAMNQTIEQRNLLTQIVRQQEDRGNMYSRMYTETQNELESVKKQSMIERVLLQALVIISLGL